MSKILCIVGPTASGKTKLSVALGQLTGGEIVSADSMQLYKDMNIGTAKPSMAERGGVPHHMLDVLDVDTEYSVAEYARDASVCIDEILSKGKLPIVVGGTGLYFDALTGSVRFEEGPGSDENIRARLWDMYEKIGADALHESLRQIDPESAENIHKNNVKRVIRAIEVYELTGRTMTEHIKRAKAQPPLYDALTIGLNTSERDILYRRIDRRVDEMVDMGLIDEAKTLYERPMSQTARQAIGYKELFASFDGRCTLPQAIAEIKQESRRYAKRQLTWFRRNEQVQWLTFDESVNFENLLEKASELLKIYGII